MWVLHKVVIDDGGGVFFSSDFNDSWIFLNGRVRDAFDLKKTFQEVVSLVIYMISYIHMYTHLDFNLCIWVNIFQVKYFAEAVGAGVGGSFQGFMKKGC